MSFVHLYASAYHWTKEYILEMPIDEHFMLSERINKTKDHDILVDSIVSLLPNMKEKARQEFLDGLVDKKKTSVPLNQKTDFEAIRRTKEEMNM
ncbi:Uncharacterised protein [Mycobacteroides abscessus subsp. abscessus]|nr:Uncharacterised protein [Mycobacteroides abscessus subsp. abscessus]